MIKKNDIPNPIFIDTGFGVIWMMYDYKLELLSSGSAMLIGPGYKYREDRDDELYEEIHLFIYGRQDYHDRIIVDSSNNIINNEELVRILLNNGKKTQS